MSETKSELNLLTRVIRNIRDHQIRHTKGYAGVDLVTLGQALDVLYFEPDGVLGTLRSLLAGDPITEQQKDTLFAFKPQEQSVTSAFVEITKMSGDHLFLPREDRTKLKQILSEKANIRHSVAMIANQYAVVGKPLDQLEVQTIVTAIEELNLAIEEADHALRK